jgi:hypothetical protein
MHIYIYNAQEEVEMKFSCIKLQRKKKNLVYVNGGRVMAPVSILKSCLTMEKNILLWRKLSLTKEF